MREYSHTRRRHREPGARISRNYSPQCGGNPPRQEESMRRVVLAMVLPVIALAWRVPAAGQAPATSEAPAASLDDQFLTAVQKGMPPRLATCSRRARTLRPKARADLRD